MPSLLGTGYTEPGMHYKSLKYNSVSVVLCVGWHGEKLCISVHAVKSFCHKLICRRYGLQCVKHRDLSNTSDY